MAVQVSPCLYFDEAAKAVDWLKDVAQFEVLMRLDEPDGSVTHAELKLGQVIIMLGTAKKERGYLSAKRAGGRTGGCYIVMRDEAALDAHYEKAKATDAQSIHKHPFRTEYGSYDYSLQFEDQLLYFGTYKPGQHTA